MSIIRLHIYTLDFLTESKFKTLLWDHINSQNNQLPQFI
jgi:hypothetical protein